MGWQSQDKKTLKRINALLKDIERGHSDGIKKPRKKAGNKKGVSSFSSPAFS